MQSNSSDELTIISNDTSELGLDNTTRLVGITIQSVYLVLCSLIIFGCLTIILPVCYYEALRHRKNYVLTAALLFGGMLIAVSSWLQAFDRLFVLIADQSHRPFSVVDCWWLPHRRMQMFSASCPLVLIVVSVDRLLLIVKPLWHMTQTARYVWAMVLPIYAHAFLLSLASFLMRPQDETLMITRMCLFQLVEPRGIRAYSLACSALGALVSVLVFGVTWCGYYRKLSAKIQVANGSMAAQNIQQKQRRFTRAFTRSTLCSLCFVVIPIGIIDAAFLTKIQPCGLICQTARSVCYLLGLCNIAADVIIFGSHEDLRKAMNAFVRLKVMPADTTLWTH